MLKWILILATILRLFWLGQVPIALNWDEVSMGYSAYSLSVTGADEWGARWPLFFRSYGEWKSAVYIYLLVPLVKFFGLTPVVVRLPSAVAGIFAVYLMYLLGKKLYSDKVGLWAAFLLAVTPWHLMLSRPAFEANIALTLVLAGLYFFLSNRLLVSAIFFGLAPHTYNSAKLVVPLLVIYLLVTHRHQFTIKKIIPFFLILALFAYPILANFSSGISQKRFSQVGLTTELDRVNAFIAYRQTSPLPVPLNRLIFNRYTYTAYHAFDNILSYFDPAYLVSNGGPHNQYRIPHRGILYLAELGLALIGAALALRTRSLLPLALILLGILPAAITKGDHHVLRSILALPGWILLAALGIDYLQHKKFKYLVIGYWLLVIETVLFLSLYFVWYPRVSASDWQYGYQQAVEYYNSHRSQYDQVVMTKWYGEPQLFVAFYSQWDPADFQSQNIPLLRYEAEGRAWLDQLEPYSVGPWTFKYLNWTTEVKNPRTLYIGKWDDFWPDSHIVDTITYPSGQVAFYLVDTADNSNSQ